MSTIRRPCMIQYCIDCLFASLLNRYFHSYADHFGVMEKIRFHTRVLSVELFDGDRWRVTTCPTDKADVGKPAEEFAKVGCA